MTHLRPGTLALLLCLAGCRGEPQNLRAHVGDGHLPPAAMGKGELVTMTLFRQTGDGDLQLNMSLSPSNRLSVFQTADSNPTAILHASPVLETTVSAETAATLRALLTPLRPLRLERNEMLLTPKGCGSNLRRPADATVYFLSKDREHFGGLMLPRNCNNDDALAVADGLRRVVKALPAEAKAGSFGW